MAKFRAHRVGIDEYSTESIQWSRDPETGNYWKTVQRYVVNISEGTTKKDGKPVTFENPYRVATEDDYDYVTAYTGPNGSEVKLYFKEIVSE